jgi:hypothetical protein
VEKPGRAVAVRTALIAVAVYAVLVVIFVIPRGGSADWFVKFGENEPSTTYAKQVVGPELSTPYDEGQDGVRFWFAARDPTLSDPTTFNTYIDWPTYRAQRVLYPALAAPFRLAGEQGLLWGLVLVNLAVVFVGTFFTSLLATELKAPRRAAYAFALNPVVIVSLVQDLADGLTLAGLIAMLYFVRRGRWGWAIVAATAAVLAKETSLLPILAVAVVARGPLVRRGALVVIPGAIAGAWALALRIRLGWPPGTADAFTPAPFSAFVDSYRYGWSVTGRYDEMLVALAIVALGVWVIVRFWHRRDSLELAACLPIVALIPFYSSTVIYRDINSIRAVGPVLTLLALDLYAGRAPRRSLTGSRRPAVT